MSDWCVRFFGDNVDTGVMLLFHSYKSVKTYEIKTVNKKVTNKNMDIL